MARIFECDVLDPAESGGVEQRIKDSLSQEKISLVVKSCAEVPREDGRPVQFILRHTVHMPGYDIYSGEVIDPITLTNSGIINITTNPDRLQPAKATLVTE